MTGKKLQRVLACLLAVLLLSQVGAFSPAVFAADSSGYTLHDGTAVIPAGTSAGDVNSILAAALIEGFGQMTADEQKAILDKGFEYQCHFMKGLAPSFNSYWGSVAGGQTKKEGLITYVCPALADNKDGDYKVRLTGTTAEVTLTKAEKLSSSITLKQGASVKLPYNEDGTLNADALRAAILQQVVDEGTTPSLTAEYTQIKYYATATTGAAVGFGKNWAPLEGGKVDGLTYPAISAGDQQIQISFKGDDTYKASSETTTVTFTERADSHIVLKSGQKVALPYTDDATVDYDALRASILTQVVEASTPALTTENTEIKYKYTVLGKDNWVNLEGGTVASAVTAKSYEIQISFKGDDTYKASSATTTVTFTERPSVQVTQKENPTFQLAFNDDGTAIYDSIQQQVFVAVIASINPALTANDVTIEYYATATSGSVGDAGKAWAPLKGGKIGILTYPAISEGTQKVRISYPGSRDYAPFTIEADVAVTGRADAPFQLKEGVTEGMTVAMVYNRDQSINYEATAQALRDALLESTDPNISIDDVTVQYNADITGITKNYKPLDCNETLVLVKFGLGNQIIHFSWSGNAHYKPLKLDDVKVNMEDHRIASAVVLKSGASITYNMDANVMLQAIFENLIDWDASTLPSKGTLSAADFTFEYYGENVLGEEDGGISGGVPNWAPVAGGTVNLLTYPQMGAGENQKVRVSYSGNDEYRPCKNVEGTLTVNKAKVSVKVHSTSIYADEAKDKLGEGFVTTDPADKFDIYTIYGGVTSDVTTSVFVQLPERMTKGTIIDLIDQTLKGLHQKTLTEMMQQGTTVGELRKLLSDIVGKGDKLSQPVKDLFKKVGIDIDTLVKLNEALNKLPGLLDNVRVAFGTPDQAGIYTVYAITNNKNYETGFGMGALVVKKHYSGVKLQWNQTIPNGKLTAEEAKYFDFGVTLMYDGNPAEKQTNVHYLYSGFTSKWKPYSSTTTPPTEPGRYVVTVVTLGGNYQAAPITRAFQITK